MIVAENGPVKMPPVEKFDQKKEIRKLARERVGIVPSAKVMLPKKLRKKPKHKKPVEAADPS